MVRTAKLTSLHLGARIRVLRNDAGLSLRQLAEHLGVSPATLSAIENGRTAISAVRLGKIAVALDTSVGTLLQEVADDATMPDSRTGDADWRFYAPLELSRLLQAALDTFSEVGYHAATMRDLADRANMSVPGVYHYYSSKQDLLVALLDLTLIDLLTRCQQAIEDGTSPVPRLTNLVECMALYHLHRAKLGVVAASEARGLSGPEAERIRGLGRQVQELFKNLVQEGCSSGDFATKNPHEAALAVMDMCVGLARWFTPGGRLTAEQLAVEYADFALNLVECRAPRIHDAQPDTSPSRPSGESGQTAIR